MFALIFSTAMLATPGMVEHVPPPTAEQMQPTMEDVPGLIGTLIQGVKDKNWQLVVAMAVMLLVVLINTLFIKFNVLGDEIRKLALPWIAAGTGCLVVFASTLLGGGSWGAAALAGFGTGAAAVGLWELVFKHIGKLLKKKAEEKKEGEE